MSTNLRGIKKKLPAQKARWGKKLTIGEKGKK